MAELRDTITVSFYPDRALNKRLEELAEKNRRSKAAQALVIIEQFFSNLETEQAAPAGNGQKAGAK